jgi:hypothetical protein
VIQLMVLSVLLGFSKRHHTVLCKIGLIANQKDARGGIAQQMHIVQPDVYVVKRLPLADVKNQNDADGISELRPGNRPEALLTGGVPDLEFHSLAIDSYRRGIKFNADCGLRI